MIARLSPAGGQTFSSVMVQLKQALSGASGNQQGMSDLLQQKSQDIVSAQENLSAASEQTTRFSSLIQEASGALSEVTPFVTCDIQSGLPTCEAQGKELVVQPLGNAVFVGQGIAGSVSSATGSFSNKSSDVNALPDRASLVSSQIQLSTGLIEQAKGLLQAGDPRLAQLDQAEKLLQDGGETNAVKPFLTAYQNAQTFVNQTGVSAAQANPAATAAQQAAQALDCKGSCGLPSPIDGTYSPNGFGRIVGMDAANQAIFSAANVGDGTQSSLQQASQALQDLQGQLTPLATLFNQVLSGIQNASSIINGINS